MYHTKSAQQKSTKIIKIALVVSWVVILAGIYYVFFWNSDSNGGNDMSDKTGNVMSGDTLTTNYYIGEKIIEEGILSPVSSFTTYTHELINDAGVKFGVKSRDHDLYQYSGSVQIKGSIDDFKQEMPIILVTEIIGDQTTSQNAASGDLYNTEFYLFEDVGVGFDLSISQGYEVIQQGSTIELTDIENGEAVLNVSAFQCSSTENLKDCVTLQNRFEEYNNDSFTSSNGITFYNLTETNTWAAFNENIYGYYLTPSSSRDLVSFADLMVFVDEKTISEALEDEAPSLCKNIDHTLTSIYEVKVTYGDEGKAEVTAQGDTDNGKQAECTLIVRLGTQYQFTLVSFVVSDQEAVNPPSNDITDEDTDIEDESDSPPTDNADNSPILDDEDGVIPPTFDANADGYSGWLSYTSMRGFTLYFSSQAVSYAGEIREGTDLDISGLDCSYQVKIIEWQRANDIDSDPDIVVYECSGNPSTAELSDKNLTLIGSTENDTVLLAKYFSAALTDLQLGVE